jgi:hypothetical protein
MYYQKPIKMSPPQNVDGGACWCCPLADSTPAIFRWFYRFQTVVGVHFLEHCGRIVLFYVKLIRNPCGIKIDGVSTFTLDGIL